VGKKQISPLLAHPGKILENPPVAPLERILPTPMVLASRPVTGVRRGRRPLEKFLPPLEKSVGHSLKNLGTSQKIFCLPGVPSWLRACSPLHVDEEPKR